MNNHKSFHLFESFKNEFAQFSVAYWLDGFPQEESYHSEIQSRVRELQGSLVGTLRAISFA